MKHALCAGAVEIDGNDVGGTPDGVTANPLRVEPYAEADADAAAMFGARC